MQTYLSLKEKTRRIETSFIAEGKKINRDFIISGERT